MSQSWYLSFRTGNFLDDVILNGGETGVRDRRKVEGFDAVDGNALGACGVLGLVYCIAALHAS
jgi:hypothetical protein